ncbi:Sir2 family NAD-dependent protein deacetylase [Jonesiaceae bacterium BS-20]|uniref:protein acetyllysine N-acetyltransferase n=1 Tax=Jonesiaceae bacterium BS-20 TaxID=3120821 RepID=A0AAU7E1F7_9MICO
MLTGAGLSTDSGIPDYRGPNATPRKPMTYQEFIGDSAFRSHYWARNHVGWRHMTAVAPNAGHHALVELERAGFVTGIITQNVDTLHQRAGSSNVIDLHGSFDRVICVDCRAVISRQSLDARLHALNQDFLVELGDLEDVEIAPDADAVIEKPAHFVVADCARCGGMLKPDVVYFGEPVPKDRVERSFAMVDSASALVVAGSSLTVHSGLRFARHAVKLGIPVAIINQGPTRADTIASLTWDMGTSQGLTAVAQQLTQGTHA